MPLMITDADDAADAAAAAMELRADNTTWAQVSVAKWHSCGVTLLGEGYCWGDNSYGQSSIPSLPFSGLAGLYVVSHKCMRFVGSASVN